MNHSVDAVYKNEGYVVLRNFFSTKEILNLARLVDSVLARWFAELGAEVARQRLVNMHSLTLKKYFDQAEDRLELFKAVTPVKLIDLLEELFEPDIHFHNTQLFFNPVDDKQSPYWHRDLQFSPVPEALQEHALSEMLNLHIRIPLVKESGVELIPGTHARWDTPLERMVRYELEGHQNSEPLPGAVLLELNPGDILIFNAQMIHRGNYQLNDSRKALDLCVGAPHELMAGMQNPEVLPSDPECKQLVHSEWYDRARALLDSKPT